MDLAVALPTATGCALHLCTRCGAGFHGLTGLGTTGKVVQSVRSFVQNSLLGYRYELVPRGTSGALEGCAGPYESPSQRREGQGV